MYCKHSEIAFPIFDQQFNQIHRHFIFILNLFSINPVYKLYVYFKNDCVSLLHYPNACFCFTFKYASEKRSYTTYKNTLNKIQNIIVFTQVTANKDDSIIIICPRIHSHDSIGV